MTWTQSRIDDNFVASTCGNFTISSRFFIEVFSWFSNQNN